MQHWNEHLFSLAFLWLSVSPSQLQSASWFAATKCLVWNLNLKYHVLQAYHQSTSWLQLDFKGVKWHCASCLMTLLVWAHLSRSLSLPSTCALYLIVTNKAYRHQYFQSDNVSTSHLMTLLVWAHSSPFPLPSTWAWFDCYKCDIASTFHLMTLLVWGHLSPFLAPLPLLHYTIWFRRHLQKFGPIWRPQCCPVRRMQHNARILTILAGLLEMTINNVSLPVPSKKIKFLRERCKKIKGKQN